MKVGNKKKYKNQPQSDKLIRRQTLVVQRKPRNGRHGFMHKQFHNRRANQSSGRTVSESWSDRIANRLFSKLRKGKTEVKEITTQEMASREAVQNVS